jgi:folate/biopterin transporter
MKSVTENSSNGEIKDEKKSDQNAKSVARKRKLVLGIGFWVQGLRCLPWMGVIFYLKDGIRVDPATLQLLQNSATIPMLAKPFYGLLSDSYYIFGQHRLPYIALGAFLQAVSWLAIAYSSNISLFAITVYLLSSNLGASIVEVANDAIVAETAKQQASSSSGELQSFVWMASSLGGVLGNLVGGIAIQKFAPQQMFYLFSILLIIQFFITVSVHEKTLNLPKNSSNVSIKTQISELIKALKKPTIYKPIAWFAASYAIIPALTSSMFYYQTENLKIDSSVLGISKVVGQVSMLIWGVVYKYNQRLKSIPPRKLISAIQVSVAVCMVSDILFVKGVYREMGVPDSVYVVVLSGVIEVLGLFKMLPFSVVIGQLIPEGCEGSLMAFLTSAIAMALMVSGYLGVALSSYVGSDFSGLGMGLLIQAACTLLPLYWSYWIPGTDEEKKKQT